MDGLVRGTDTRQIISVLCDKCIIDVCIQVPIEGIFCLNGVKEGFTEKTVLLQRKKMHPF